MNRSIFAIASETVNGIWKISGEVVDAVVGEYENFIDEETTRRIIESREKANSKYANMTPAQIKQQVRKEVKSFAVRGGLIAFGVGALF